MFNVIASRRRINLFMCSPRMLRILAMTLIWLLLPTLAYASHIPPPTNFVNDFAHVLTQSQLDDLNHLLADYQQTTGNEIAVALVKSLNGGDITDFSVKAFEEWKIGKKGADNGILILAAIEERKITIEVGYGLETYLTDAQAGDIIRNVVAPSFKNNDYYGGLKQGIEAIEQHLAGAKTFKVEIRLSHEKVAAQVIKLLFHSGIGLYLVILLLIYLISYMARSKSFWLGGVVGGGTGALFGWIFVSLILGVVLSVVLGGFGLFLDYILSKNYLRQKALGKNHSWWDSLGGFWYGGGSSDRSSGFGGFGAGSSGGGGASGDW